MNAAHLGRTYPHCLPAALCAGIAAAHLARFPSAAAATCVLAAATAVLTSRALRLAALLIALAGAGWCWGSVRLQALDRSMLISHVDETRRALAVVTGPSRRSEFAVRVPAVLKRFGELRPDERVLLELPPARAPPQGALVELIATVEKPRAAETGFDERTWLRRQGVHVVLHGDHWRMVGRRGGLVAVSDRLRSWLERSLAPGLHGERRAVLAGVVLGADEGLSQDLRDRFRSSGLYHLLAVSGQNVAFLAAGILLCAWLLGVPRLAAELAALAAIGAYVAAVGWQPSVVRAGVAGALASLAWLASRPRDRWYFLLVGALVLLAWNPYGLLEPGFQLSFTAVAAIFVAVPALERALVGYPLPKRLATVVAVSAGCGLATAPVLWLHFGAVPVYSVLSNALAAPAVAPLLGLGLLTAAFEPLSPALAGALAWLNGWLAAYVAACARLVGGLPGAQVSSTTAILGMVAGAGAALAAFRARPPRLPRVGALLAIAALIVGGWRLWPDRPPLPPPQGLRVTVLDVGQGDSTLIQVPGGAVLVDQGPPEARVADQLRRLGVRRLDVLVLTHPSRDNIGGAEEVIRRLDVGLVLEPKLPYPNPYGSPALAAARERGIEVLVTRAGQTYRVGDLRIRVLWPVEAPIWSNDPNDHATVLLASYGATDALLLADAESNVSLRVRPPPVEILKVAHHGSADDGLPELLRLVRPDVALISVGADNDYGHPAPSTLAALDQVSGLSMYRTDRDGAVAIESDGHSLWVRRDW